MADQLDSPLSGFNRQASGWLVKRVHPHAAKIRELKSENAELRERIAGIEEAVQTILAAKTKQKK